jgi:hypothetical protein
VTTGLLIGVITVVNALSAIRITNGGLGNADRILGSGAHRPPWREHDGHR